VERSKRVPTGVLADRCHIVERFGPVYGRRQWESKGRRRRIDLRYAHCACKPINSTCLESWGSNLFVQRIPDVGILIGRKGIGLSAPRTILSNPRCVNPFVSLVNNAYGQVCDEDEEKFTIGMAVGLQFLQCCLSKSRRSNQRSGRW